jgi:hypothetical protein
MNMVKNKKAAIELSMGTIVIIVLGVTMLILGMVLVRAVMCSAIGLTDSVGKKASSELESYFGQTGEEVICIGEQEAAKMAPDSSKDNVIYCAVRAPQTAEYTFKITDYGSTAGIRKEQIQQWIKLDSSKFKIAPSDNPVMQKVARLRIPENAPEGNIWLTIEVQKDGELAFTKTIDYEVTRLGFVRASIC